MSKHSNRMPVTTTTSRERIAAAHAAADATVTEEKAPKAQKTPRDKFVRALGAMQKATQRLLNKLDTQINITQTERLGAISVAVSEAAGTFSELSPDWSPRARKPHGVPSFIVGSVVSVRDKKREDAAAILDEGEMVGLTVVKIAGKLVRLVTPSGATVAAPKAWFRADKKA